MPAANEPIVVLVPVPVIDPGLIVQLPAGNPLNTTLPVAVEQVGCVIVPTVGADDGVHTGELGVKFAQCISPPPDCE